MSGSTGEKGATDTMPVGAAKVASTYQSPLQEMLSES